MYNFLGVISEVVAIHMFKHWSKNSKSMLKLHQLSIFFVPFINFRLYFDRIDAELQVYEEKYAFQRWELDSEIFQDIERISEKDKEKKLLDSIATCAHERWFLLQLKSKFAGTCH